MKRRNVLGSLAALVPASGFLTACATPGDTTLHLDKGRPVFVDLPKQPERSGISMGMSMIGGWVGATVEDYRRDVYRQGQEWLSKLPSEKRTDFAALFRDEFLNSFAAAGGLLAPNTALGQVTIGFTGFAVCYAAADITSSYRPIAIIVMTASNDRHEITKGYARAILGRNPGAPTFTTLASLLEQPEVVMANLKVSTIDMAQQAAAMVVAAQLRG